MRPYTITAPNGTVLYSPGQDEFSPRQIRPFNSLISMHVIPVKRLNPNTGQTVILNRVIVWMLPMKLRSAILVSWS